MTVHGFRTFFFFGLETSATTAVNIKDLVLVFPGLLVNTFIKKEGFRLMNKLHLFTTEWACPLVELFPHKSGDHAGEYGRLV